MSTLGGKSPLDTPAPFAQLGFYMCSSHPQEILPGTQTSTRGGVLGGPPQDQTLPQTPFSRSGDKSDETPMLFYHAEVPEIMLEIIQQSFGSDFFIRSAKMRCVPSLALAVLTSFMYVYSDSPSCPRSFSMRPPWTACLRGRFATS